MPERLAAVMDTARLITVGHLARRPLAFRPGIGVTEVLAEARDLGFTYVFVEGHEGAIQKWVVMERLPSDPDWHDIDHAAVLVPPERRVESSTPIFDVLDALETLEILAVREDGEVTGVVTAWDLNRPGAQLFGFGLCLAVEGQVARLTSQYVRGMETGAARPTRGAAGSVALVELIRAEGGQEEAADYVRSRAEDRHLEPLAHATFNTVLAVAKRCGATSEIAQRLGSPSSEALNQELHCVREFRNAVAHEKRHLLENEHYVLEELRRAHDLAHRLAGVEILP